MTNCDYKLENCYRKDEPGDCLRCRRIESEARYWSKWAISNGYASWEAQKERLRKIRGNESVNELVRIMNYNL